MGIISKLANPRQLKTMLRRQGFGRVMNTTFKRTGLPLSVGRGLTRAAKIAANPIDYASRKLGARSYLRRVRPSVHIPEEQGYAVCPAGTLEGSARVLEICRRIYADCLPQIGSMGGRYGINLLASDLETWSNGNIDLRGVPELVDFAVSDALLAPCIEYLGEIPVLGDLQIYVTTPMQTNVGNNFYHFDKPYSRLLKFWMAIEDVDAGSGPFTFLPVPASRVVRRDVPNAYVGRSTDEAVYRAVSPNEKIEFVGTAGNGLWVDTCRCAHYGSRTRERNRVILQMTYITPFWWGEPTLYFIPALHDAARYRDQPVRSKVLSLMSATPPGDRKLGTYE